MNATNSLDHSRCPFSSRSKARAGFTLIEMMMVMTIISVAAYLCAPAFSSIRGGKAVGEGMYQISSILQLARSEAVTRQTYVWVGFSQSTDSNGVPELTFIVSASRDGSTNRAQTNLTNLTPPIRIKGVVMAPWSDLKSATTAMFTRGTPVSVGGAGTGAIQFPNQTTAFTHTLTFTPRGQAMQLKAPGPDDPYDAFLDVSFRQSNNGKTSMASDDGSIIVEGATGTIVKVRVQ